MKRVNPEEKLDLFKQFFWIKPVKMGEILIKMCFSPQSEPHTAKLCFSIVLKYILGNSQRNSLFNPKKILSQKGTLKYSEIVFS